MLSAGATVGRYVIEGVLGEGGMGTVYRASDPVLGRKVALKVVRTKDEAGQKKSEGTSRLLREARAAAALTHPFAVAIYDVGEVMGDPFIAMEFVSGKTLSTALLEDAHDLPTRLRWLSDVARVLDAAHRQGIVHRDIKPDNVMLRDDGTVKVLDFGIARQRVETPFDGISGSAATLTAKGTTVGTPLYMAPEQMLGEDLDGRADQFSWGVMAFEVLSRDLPWGSPQDGVGIMYAILKKAAPPLKEKAPEVPQEVADLVARTLEKEAEHRYPSMADVVAELEPFAAAPVGDAPMSRAARSTSRPSQPGVEKKGMVPATMVLAFIGVVGVTAAIVAKVKRSDTPAAVPSASASATPRAARAITDQPLPDSKSSEALAAYKAGIQAIRDGAMGPAIDNLGRATTLDPSLASAHLRLALYGSNGGVPTRSTNAFQRALQLRTALSPRDQDLVSALEPYMNRERVDLEETDRRLSALAAKLPEDAEIAYLLGAVRFDRDARSMMGELERASSLDPAYVPPIAIRAHGLAYLGDLEGARRAFDECAKLAATSSLCAFYQASLDQQEGDCAKIETVARRVLVAEPDSTSTLSVLAGAASMSHPREAVKALLDQKAQKTREAVRKQATLRDTMRMEILYGDFDAAEAVSKDYLKALAGETHQAAHASATLLLAELYLETGRAKDAGKLAHDFMKTRAAWVPPTNVEDYSIRDDATIPMLTVMLRAGVLDRATFAKERDQWLAEWRKIASPFYHGYLWIHGFAAPAETKADGEEAVAALPSWGGIPAYRSQTSVDGQIGLALRLGGKADEGLAYLRRGAKTCRALFEPFAHVRAVLSLAQALEEKGDKDGACAGYKQVLDRWGAAKKSLSAEKARARSRALSCK